MIEHDESFLSMLGSLQDLINDQNEFLSVALSTESAARLKRAWLPQNEDLHHQTLCCWSTLASFLPYVPHWRNLVRGADLT